MESVLPPSFDPRWLYGLRSVLVLAVLVALWRHFGELRVAQTSGLKDWGSGLAVGLLVFVLWIYLDLGPLAFERGEGFDPRVGGRISFGFAATRLAGAALVVPVVEELFWRSFILRVLQRSDLLRVDPSTVGWTAILISSAVFASEHRLWFAGFLAGVAYAWLYKRSGNLWVPIFAHAITNGLLGAYVLATGSWWFW